MGDTNAGNESEPATRAVGDGQDGALVAGHLSFEIDREKLQGGWVLQRFGDEDDQWLLIEEDDADADAQRNPTSTQRESVLSWQTMVDIAESDGADR